MRECEKEIEVTPEMIEIGVRIIRTYFDQPNDSFTKAIVEELLFETLEYGRPKQNYIVSVDSAATSECDCQR